MTPIQRLFNVSCVFVVDLWGENEHCGDFWEAYLTRRSYALRAASSNYMWLTSNVLTLLANYEVMKLVESRELQGFCLCGSFNQKAHLHRVHTHIYIYIYTYYRGHGIEKETSHVTIVCAHHGVFAFVETSITPDPNSLIEQFLFNCSERPHSD